MNNQARQQIDVNSKDEHLIRLMIAWLDKSYMSARFLSHRIENSSLYRSLMRVTLLKRQATQDLRQAIDTPFPLFMNPKPPQDDQDMTLMMNMVVSDKHLIDKGKTIVKNLESNQLAHKVSYWIAALQMEIEATHLTLKRLR